MDRLHVVSEDVGLDAPPDQGEPILSEERWMSPQLSGWGSRG